MLGFIKNRASQIRQQLREKAELSSLGKLSSKEKALIEQLRGQIKTLSSKEMSATEFWSKKRKELFDQIQNHDPRNFTRWKVMYPMFFEPDPLELERLRSSPNWKEYEKVLKEDRIGNPTPYKNYPASSGNLIHHLYSLNEFCIKTGKQISDRKVIFEFGGGYGSFCRLCYRMGFKGSYVIFDLPEYSIFQNYFLSSLELPLNVSLSKVSIADNTTSLISDINELSKMPSPDLFVALWSLSETPVELRDKVLGLLSGGTDHLIAYQNEFQGIDNGSYFEKFKNSKKDVDWSSYPISHIKGSNYLFGRSA